MQIEIFNFSKDKKSTKVPDGSGTIHDIVLKDNTSVIEPTFILSMSVTPTFNYVRFLFSYYFVEDVTLQHKDIYEVKCRLDILGTYRNDILSSSQFVLRSASDYNIFLNDEEMQPATNQLVEQYVTTTNFFDGSTYILRVLGKANLSSVDTIPTYILDEIDMANLLNHFFDPLGQIISDTNHIVDALRMLVCSPFNNIVSIHWIPHNIVGGAAETINIGIIQTGVTAQHLTSYGARDHGLLHIPTPYYNDFRDFDENYTQFNIILPALGIVRANPADVYAGIGLSMLMDYLTGDVIYYLYNSQTNAPLAKYKVNVKADIQFGGRIGAGSTGSANVISESKGFGLLHDAFIGNYSSFGNISSRMDINTFNEIRIIRRIMHSSEYGTSRVGRPLREMRTLSNLSGYCQCEDAKLDTSAYGEVKQELLDYMNNGFIIE